MAFEIIFILVYVFMFLIFLAYAFLSQEVYLKFFFSLAAGLIMMLTLNSARVIAVSNGYTTSDSIVRLLNTSYVLFVWMFFAVFIIALVMYVSKLVRNYKIRKEEDDD